MPPSPNSSSSSNIDIILPAHSPPHYVPNHPTSDIRTPLLASSQHRPLRNPLSVFFSSPSRCSTPSFLTKLVMLITFISFTFLLPILTSLSTKLPTSASSDHISFNLLVQFPESSLSIVSFLTLYSTLSNNRHDSQQCHDSPSVLRSYSSELSRAFKHILLIFVPSFIIEVAHKLVYLSKANVVIPYFGKFLSPGLNRGIVMVFVLGSWAYRTGIFLVVCMVFRLTCELQILRFLGLVNMLEGEECMKDTRSVFEEHVRIRKELSATSHRYRFFIIGCMVTITVSLFGVLLLVLGSMTKKTFLNSGDLLVCAVVELSGLFLCLMGAARITHRAQGIASVASRWHMLVTSSSSSNSSSPASHRSKNGSGDINNIRDHPVLVMISEEDPDSSFRTRQALVAYLQHNNGGITLYGFALDRGLLHTIFAFEFSLALWILSKVVVLS